MILEKKYGYFEAFFRMVTTFWKVAHFGEVKTCIIFPPIHPKKNTNVADEASLFYTQSPG